MSPGVSDVASGADSGRLPIGFAVGGLNRQSLEPEPLPCAVRHVRSTGRAWAALGLEQDLYVPGKGAWMYP